MSNLILQTNSNCWISLMVSSKSQYYTWTNFLYITGEKNINKNPWPIQLILPIAKQICFQELLPLTPINKWIGPQNTLQMHILMPSNWYFSISNSFLSIFSMQVQSIGLDFEFKSPSKKWCHVNYNQSCMFINLLYPFLIITDLSI